MEKILNVLKERQNELYDILSNLIKIDSQNFGYSGNEKEIAYFIGEELKKLGYEPDIYSPVEVEGALEHSDYWHGHNLEGRYNVSALIEGKDHSRRIMVAAHLDTVPVGDESNWTVPPFGGVIKDGWIKTDISSLGCYEVAIDTLPPVVRPVNEKQWGRSGRLSFYMSDSETGVKSYKGYIDGKFKLFKFSSKDVRLTCDLRAEGVSRGTHQLRLVVTDRAGNETTIEKTFKY